MRLHDLRPLCGLDGLEKRPLCTVPGPQSPERTAAIAVTTITSYPIPDLLERAGARLRGRNRADCPLCGGQRTVSYSDELYCCHHAGCDFRGNIVTLVKRLGLARRFSRGEALAHQRDRDEARAAAEYARQRIKAERHALYEAHRSLLTIRGQAEQRLRKAPDDALAWGALACVNARLPQVKASLAILEDAPIPTRLDFLNACERKRKEMDEKVIRAGGLLDAWGKFIEVA